LFEKELSLLQQDLMILTNPQLFADLSGRITDFSGVFTIEHWQLEIAKENIKQEMQFMIDVRDSVT
jgi:hypothetical protein